MTNAHRYELCAAIDFGTTYSGLAYSYDSDKEKVHITSQWPGGVSNKMPTAVLFDKSKTAVAFGENASSKYCKHIDEGDFEEYYFFHRFKMILYQNKNINKDLYLEDVGGKKMKAINVFSAIIRFMVEHLILSINKRKRQNNLKKTSVRWVLTVPAIWSTSAKVFMRQAAELAGIQSQHLVIALEPECASLHCRRESKEKISTVEFKKENAKYLVMDNGGGTIDVAAHQVIAEKYVKEIFKATGGNWGGTKVDELFIEYLEQLFTKENVNEVKRERKADWLQILKDFENAKTKIAHQEKDPTLSILYSERIWNENHFKTINESIRKGAYIKGKRLHIEVDVIKDMIKQVSLQIKRHGESLLKLKEMKDIDAIMLVGGFSNSTILVNNIKAIVGPNIPVVVPEEAELSVVKGAVLFGWNQEIVVSRRAKYTYGVEASVDFVSGKHPERYAYVSIGEYGRKIKKCDYVFDKLVTVNQEIKLNEIISRTYEPVSNDQTAMKLSICITCKDEAVYTKDEGVQLIGELTVPMPDTTKGVDRIVSVQFTFGCTELKVRAVDESSRKTTKGSFAFHSG